MELIIYPETSSVSVFCEVCHGNFDVLSQTLILLPNSTSYSDLLIPVWKIWFFMDLTNLWPSLQWGFFIVHTGCQHVLTILVRILNSSLTLIVSEFTMHNCKLWPISVSLLTILFVNSLPLSDCNTDGTIINVNTSINFRPFKIMCFENHRFCNMILI